METRVVLIRHGHTTSNGSATGMTMSGWTDVPLSPTGHIEAERLAARLRMEPPFDAIYTSPLRRAQETAARIAAASAPRSGVLVAEDLREINCGEVDGLPVEYVERVVPELWALNMRQDDPDFRWPGGESYREFRSRCLAGMRRIVSSHLGSYVGVVTHAGVICQVLGEMAGLGPARWETYRPSNASLSEVVWSGAAPVLVRFDDHSHLDLQGG
jgi:broad specificity phosphatase PhoE